VTLLIKQEFFSVATGGEIFSLYEAKNAVNILNQSPALFT
jgi:hypothetical protein